MEREIDLKFILNRDQHMMMRKPIFAKLEGLLKIKAGQKLVLRVQKPRSLLSETFCDDVIVPVPRSVSPHRNASLTGPSRLQETLHNPKLDKLNIWFDEAGIVERPRCGSYRTATRRRWDKTNVLRVTGTAALVAAKPKLGRQSESPVPRLATTRLGALTKVVISKKGRPLSKKPGVN
jgi:hypothetical protein